jgi:hypothetical protein
MLPPNAGPDEVIRNATPVLILVHNAFEMAAIRALEFFTPRNRKRRSRAESNPPGPPAMSMHGVSSPGMHGPQCHPERRSAYQETPKLRMTIEVVAPVIGEHPTQNEVIAELTHAVRRRGWSVMPKSAERTDR